jgi:AraC-like DNA-binding protein
MERDRRELRGAWASFQHLGVAAPSGDLAPFVARYWTVDWDLRGQPPYRQLIVPYPNVHLSFVSGQPATVTGLARGPVVRELAGHGRVLGVAFRPGCFRPFLGRPVATITGRALPGLFDWLPADGAVPDVAAVEDLLRAHLPPRDPTAEALADLVDEIAADPALTRVDGVAARLGTGIRRLQRLFVDYVGVGPKWVIRRYRLHEVTKRMETGERVDWAGLAAELGYADQAHLVRDFTAMVGESPTWYARRYPSVGPAATQTADGPR